MSQLSATFGATFASLLKEAQFTKQLLSDFTEGDRYSNINILIGSQRQSDPIASWFTQVDLPLFESKVSSKKKARIADNARIAAEMLGPFSMVLHSSETGTAITDVAEASRRTGIYESVVPYRQLHVLQIVRFWARLIRGLQYVAQSLDQQDIPFFGELFAPFENDDSYILTRKTWDGI